LFAWNSPYSYAENDVVRSIDLDGLEKLVKNVTQDPNSDTGEPGRASISIVKNYTVITSGVGAVSDYSRLDPSEFSSTYDRGDRTVFMSQLPTAESAGVYLSKKHSQWAKKATNNDFSEKKNIKYANKLKESGINYYIVDIDYQYSLQVEEGVDILEATSWMEGDPSARGVIGMGLTQQESTELWLSDGGADASTGIGAYVAFNEYAMGTSFVYEPDAPAAGSINTVSSFDITILNPNEWFDASNYDYLLTPNDPMGNSASSRTGVLVHEGGHSSTDYDHKSIEYDGTPYTYSKEGLQNNTKWKTYPTEQNTRTILDNAKNRSTL
jgi:hypothetical protein